MNYIFLVDRGMGKLPVSPPEAGWGPESTGAQCRGVVWSVVELIYALFMLFGQGYLRYAVDQYNKSLYSIWIQREQELRNSIRGLPTPQFMIKYDHLALLLILELRDD